MRTQLAHQYQIETTLGIGQAGALVTVFIGLLVAAVPHLFFQWMLPVAVLCNLVTMTIKKIALLLQIPPTSIKKFSAPSLKTNQKISGVNCSAHKVFYQNQALIMPER